MKIRLHEMKVNFGSGKLEGRGGVKRCLGRKKKEKKKSLGGSKIMTSIDFLPLLLNFFFKTLKRTGDVHVKVVNNDRSQTEYTVKIESN